jgi:hypothetical protein
MSVTYPHVMLDLETMGVSTDAPIIAIGAVAFDIDRALIGPTFYTEVSLQSAMQQGGVIDADTVMWWLKQSEEARKALTETPDADKPHINVAISNLSMWIRRMEALQGYVCTWGNGPDFDQVLLAKAYAKALYPMPWKFWMQRCYRTVKGLHPEVVADEAEGFVKHRADHDALHQAMHLIKILNPTGYAKLKGEQQ